MLLKIAKKISNMITKNLGWKLVSILIAIIMWFIVVNNANPITPKRFLVPLQIHNRQVLEDNEYVILNAEEITSSHVELYVRAAKNVIDQLSQNPESIEAFIDLKPIDISRSNILGEPLPITINYNLPIELAEVIQQTPRYMDIILDRYESKTMFAVLEKVGELTPGYVDLPYTIEPSRITVSGPKSYVDQVAALKIPIDVTNASQDLTITSNLSAFNESGKDITANVKLSANTVTATLPIKKYASLRITNPVIVGNVAPGYVINNITMEPRYVEVVGDEEAIEKAKPIILEPINVDNLKKTKSFSFDLRSYFLETDLSIKNFSPYIAVVTVNLEKELEKQHKIASQDILIIGGNGRVVFDLDAVTINLKGIERYHNNEVKASIDLSGLYPGHYTVPLKIEAGYGLSLTDEPPKISVTILEPE